MAELINRNCRPTERHFVIRTVENIDGLAYLFIYLYSSRRY